MNRGHLRLRLGELEPAIADFDQALALQPEAPLAYVYRGLARRLQKRDAEAKADFGRAMELEPRLTDRLTPLVDGTKQH